MQMLCLGSCSVSRGCLWGLVILLLSTPLGYAHKVLASVYAAGDTIEGEIGFSNGDPAAHVLVEVFDSDQQKLGETTTDEDGFFIFEPNVYLPHHFYADLGAGHIAQVALSPDELPRHLAPTHADTPQAPATPTASTVNPDALVTLLTPLIAEAVRDEVRPLRREIASYKEKNDLQTILGGIGYILGLCGIVFYLMAQRKLKQAKASKPPLNTPTHVQSQHP